MKPIIDLKLPTFSSDDPWKPAYPNSPDLAFNYFKLLNDVNALKVGIGTVKDTINPPKVAIIGAGIAGLTTARELYRCGFDVTIYEATDRICGRQYTETPRGGTEPTGIELGAMRFPFFNDPTSSNSLLGYYAITEGGFGIEPFPNPGAAPGNTGIYVNRGYGPNNIFDKPELILWPKSDNPYNPPNNPDLKVVYDKVNAFVELFTSTVGPLYVGSDWLSSWQKISNQYDQMTVSDLVYTAAQTAYEDDGWFGGFGMTKDEAQLFSVIGSGDGSWGAFFEVGAMWFIRCVVFGYNSNLQSVTGIADKSHAPHYFDVIKDSNGTPIASPNYNGIQSLGEWMFYAPSPSTMSLYDATLQNEAKIYVQSPVISLEKVTNGFNVVSLFNGRATKVIFDYVVATPTLWASQVNIDLLGFGKDDIPAEVIAARNSQHNITSCKIFYPLKELYWEQGSKIPQILVTDTFAQDAYGVHWGDGRGAMLLSYTWEDDAAKLLPEDDIELAALMLTELDKITMDTVGENLSDYLDTETPPTVIHWSRQPYARGCAKLYRQRNWSLNYSLLAYNQTQSADSNLYFAGENYGVEGGWTEPALRLSIDAVINLLRNSGGTFNNNFSPSVSYPSYDTSFAPDNKYPPAALR